MQNRCPHKESTTLWSMYCNSPLYILTGQTFAHDDNKLVKLQQMKDDNKTLKACLFTK